MVVEELGQSVPPEGPEVAYKVVLPPPASLAREIAAFANTNGGQLVIGIADDLRIVGMDPEVPVEAVVEAALRRMQPRPFLRHYPATVDGHYLYMIEILKADTPVAVEGDKIFVREGSRVQQIAPALHPPWRVSDPHIQALLDRIAGEMSGAN